MFILFLNYILVLLPYLLLIITTFNSVETIKISSLNAGRRLIVVDDR